MATGDNKPSFSELANDPIEVTLLGKTYKARRVSLDAVFGRAESAVLSGQMKRIHAMADDLSGEDKTSFLAKAMLESLPSGNRLATMTADFLRGIEGLKLVLIEALKTDQPEIGKQLVDIVEIVSKEKDKITALVEWLTGVGKKPTIPLTDSPASP